MGSMPGRMVTPEMEAVLKIDRGRIKFGGSPFPVPVNAGTHASPTPKMWTLMPTWLGATRDEESSKATLSRCRVTSSNLGNQPF